jgi:hypothetical protein
MDLTAAKVASQDRDKQAQIVQRFKAEIEAGKKPKLSTILKELLPPSEGDAEKRLEKVARSLEANLKSLEGISTALSQENLAKMKLAAQKIVAKLTEIETHSLDQTGQIDTDSDESATEVVADNQENHSVCIEPSEDDIESDDSEIEDLDGNSSDSMENLAEFPEGWDRYREPIEREEENQL